jgi:hypothetical protein
LFNFFLSSFFLGLFFLIYSSIHILLYSNSCINNLLGSILREFILQYKPFVKNYNEILLLGGIAKKIQNLPELFQIYYPESKIILLENGIESTHKGMIKYIKEEL